MLVGAWVRSQLWTAKGGTIWIVDAHGYGERFIVRADEKLTAFVELESSIRSCDELPLFRHS
jgi:hypothetical protein